jgi:hypothetical protein
MARYFQKHLPILLNYTGKHISMIPVVETRHYTPKDGRLSIPPIGSPKIKVVSIKEPDALYATMECIVEGVPPEADGALIIVNEDVARILCGARKDIMVPYGISDIFTDSKINTQELSMFCEGLAHYIMSTTSKR